MERLKRECADEDFESVAEAAVTEAYANRLLLQSQKDAGFPSFATFVRALHDPAFVDVQKREKHFHCRCPTCSELQTRLRQRSRSFEDRAVYESLFKRHHFEIKHWRALEHEMHTAAKLCPEKVTVLSYDDTGAFGFPRMTNRPIKNITNYRVFMVPFNLTNHGTGENVYYYNTRDKWSKGGDRICSILYNTIRRIKTKPDADATEVERAQKKSRKVVLMADNASENKNDTLFDFLTELVMRGWYDEIQMLFGPVGQPTTATTRCTGYTIMSPGTK